MFSLCVAPLNPAQLHARNSLVRHFCLALVYYLKGLLISTLLPVTLYTMGPYSMSDEDRNKLKKKRLFLINNMELSEEFFAYLLQEDILTEEKYRRLKLPILTEKEKAGQFLDYIVKRGPKAFDRLIYALVQTDQERVAFELDPNFTLTHPTQCTEEPGKKDIKSVNPQQKKEEEAAAYVYLDPRAKTLPPHPGMEKPHQILADFMTVHRTPFSYPQTFTYTAYCDTCHSTVSIITEQDSLTVGQLSDRHQLDMRDKKVH